MCFVDLKKAFDSVNHNLLWEKLKSHGFSYQMLKVLQSMYSKATSRVRISASEATDSFPCKKGVRQGCNLSPLLFSLFLTGLEVELKKNRAGVVLNGAVLDVMMFADDIVLFSCTSEGLKKHLLTLESFCNKHMLEVNTSKTKICVFGKKYNQHYKWKDTDLEIVNAYKYLGVWINSNGNYNTAKKFLGNQARKAVYSAKKSILYLQFPPPVISLKLYVTLVKPILCYGCEIWGFNNDRELELIELKYLKYILCLPLSTTNAAVRGELGQLPLHLFWKERIIKYWHRLSSGFIPSLLQHALSEQLALDKGGKECWLSKTKDIYDKAGLSNLHVSANMDNIKDHVNIIMTRYRDQYVQEWFAQIQRPLSIRGNALNKLRTYKLFKHQFQLEKYLLCINITKHRIALTKLRVSSHCLAIETGRYHKPTSLPVDQRLCDECGVLEDEAHFLCDCVRYSFLREDLFSAAIPYFPEFSMLTSREKFLFLLQTEYTCILKALGSFVYRAFKLHH